MYLLVLCVVCVYSMDPEIVDLLTPLRELGEACGYDVSIISLA